MSQLPQHLLVLEDDHIDNGNDKIDQIQLVQLPSDPNENPFCNSSDLAYLRDQFRKLHHHGTSSREPDCITRAPGRCNIIGEHIDYNGFGVLPMALKQSVFVAAAAAAAAADDDDDDDINHHSNTNNNSNVDVSQTVRLDIQSTSFPAESRHYSYPVDHLLSDPQSHRAPFDASKKDWSHYVLCGFFGILEERLYYVPEHSDDDAAATTKTTIIDWKDLIRGKHISLLVHGTVPQGAGVSSSSALVVSSALAVLALLHLLLHQQKQTPCNTKDFDMTTSSSTTATTTTTTILPLSRSKMARLCARCERWVGTQGGGMDQAISLFAQEGSGRYIQFQPTFQHKSIPLPENGSWVVCHSLEESHKRHDAATLFNKRVVECQIGCRLLADALDWKNQHHGKDGYPSSLWELVSRSGMSLMDLENFVRLSIVESCSKDDLATLLLESMKAPQNVDLVDCLAAELGIVRDAGKQVLQMAESFQIRDRLLHVLSETRRVQEFVSVSSEDPTMHQRFDTNTATPSVLQSMGVLMNNSHRSCSELYDCSSAQVDRLQQICLQADGSIGARMTGAGWGGCVIALVDTLQVASFCNYVRQHYYKTLPDHLTSGRSESDYMFVTRPSQGSQVFTVGKSRN